MIGDPYVEQRAQVGPEWVTGPAPNLYGYEVPAIRSRPALSDDALAADGPLISVIGTLRNEVVPASRSWLVWSRQELPAWLRGRVEFVFLDEGSSDGAEAFADACARDAAKHGIGRVRYVRTRDPGDPVDRSCTLAFNLAIRTTTAPTILVQWWDRIPGSFHHLRALAEPHRDRAGIATSATSRHVGGSSSMAEMTPETLAGTLAMVPWLQDPGLLERVAGPIGGHCVPGRASESSGFLVATDELRAIGGYDERYQDRAGYANVELWRRLFQAGLVALFPVEKHGQNFHQSHAANRAKDKGFLDEPLVRRNLGVEWGHRAVVLAEWTS